MQRRRPLPIPSPLRQMRRACSNSNSDAASIPERRMSTASTESSVSSIPSIASTSSAGSWCSGLSTRSSSRRQSLLDSVTAPLSRMSLSDNRTRSRLVSNIDPGCKPSGPPLSVASLFYRTQGILRVKLVSSGLRSGDEIDIPLKYCNRDKQDRILGERLQEEDFSNCRLSGIVLSENAVDCTVTLQRRPVLTLDGGKYWKCLWDTRATDYIENFTGKPQDSGGISYGQGKVRLLNTWRNVDQSRSDVWLDWSLINDSDDKHLTDVNAMSPHTRLRTITGWIRAGRLTFRFVTLNSCGRAISGDFGLKESGFKA